MAAKTTGLFGSQYEGVPHVSELLNAARSLLSLPPPQLDPHSGNYQAGLPFRLVRDDYLAGGTKLRVLLPLLRLLPHKAVSYASPAYGYAQIALAHAARMTGKQAHIFVAKRAAMHPRTKAAQDAGATIHEVPHGYLSVVQKWQREFCKEWGAFAVPFGGNFPGAVELIAHAASKVRYRPTEFWCVAGSGTLYRGLKMAWPDARAVAVQIGATPNLGYSKRSHGYYCAPEKFEHDAKQPPPFPSCSNYDAKAWQFFSQHATRSALFWNVGS